MSQLSCFKAYDIRGRLGDELNEEIAHRIGRAYAEFTKARIVVVGGDVRLSSESLKLALSRGLQERGVDVLDIGLCGTEEVYFATFYLGIDGGIQVTASHNPIDYNGMKLVKKEARPISADTGLKEISRYAGLNLFSPLEGRLKGSYKKISTSNVYIEHLMGYIHPPHFTPLKLVLNSGNGAAGPVIDMLEKRFNALKVPLTLIKIHHQPDGTFPNGIPNALLPERRQATSDAVLAEGADMGIAFDGDFDRCFFFDHQGQFIEGYYMVGLLAEAFLQKERGARIIHDPRLTWNTMDRVKAYGGKPIMSRTGHAFIKERMRLEDAVYGGEMSAHHYFRDFAYCDSGMIPWLLIAELLCVKGQKLQTLVKERMAAYPVSGEINCELVHPDQAIRRVRAVYQPDALSVDETDGISMEFKNWRFNLRSSNTEPVVRLNVESRADKALLDAKVAGILKLLTQ